MSDARKPDIKTDPILVIGGGTSFLYDREYKIPDTGSTWITKIPVDLTEEEKKGRWPREGFFRVVHDIQIGTVDQLVEKYREGLTNAFNALAEQPTIGSWAAHCERLGKLQENKPYTMKISREALAEFHAPKHLQFGCPKPHQPEWVRDKLKRLVGDYFDHSRYLPDRPDQPELYPTVGPTDNPEYIQRLIDALTTLKEDALAERTHDKREQPCSTAAQS